MGFLAIVGIAGVSQAIHAFVQSGDGREQGEIFELSMQLTCSAVILIWSSANLVGLFKLPSGKQARAAGPANAGNSGSGI